MGDGPVLGPADEPDCHGYLCSARRGPPRGGGGGWGGGASRPGGGAGGGGGGGFRNGSISTGLDFEVLTVASTSGFRFFLRARFLRTDITAKPSMHFIQPSNMSRLT